jgi:hypothetical protein
MNLRIVPLGSFKTCSSTGGRVLGALAVLNVGLIAFLASGIALQRSSFPCRKLR